MAGGQISAALFLLEQYVLRRNAGGIFRPLPFLPYLALRSLLYVTVIFIVIALPPRPPTAIGSADFLFTLVVVVGATLLLSVNDLQGPGTLFAFAAGRYYEPRTEERALLFIDMRSSTVTAERLGELRFLKLLNRFIIDLTLAIDEPASKSTNMSATRSSSRGGSAPARTKRHASAIASQRSIGAANKRPLMSASSGLPQTSAPACTVAGWPSARSALSKKRSL